MSFFVFLIDRSFFSVTTETGTAPHAFYQLFVEASSDAFVDGFLSKQGFLKMCASQPVLLQPFSLDMSLIFDFA